MNVSGGGDSFRFVTQSDQKIVGVGDAGNDLVVARFNTNGTLDTSFNTTGYRVINIGSTDQAHGVAVQADGKIVVSGYVDSDLLLMRLNVDGSYDASFDGPGVAGNGKFLVHISGIDNGRDVAIQTDGQIVVGGISVGNFFVGRFNASDGSWDTSYDTDGYQTVDFGGTDRGFELSLDKGGKAVLVGETTTGSGGDIAIIRLNTNGSLDTSFDTDGKKTISLSGGQDSSRALAIDSQNRLVLAGTGTGDLEVIRLNAGGSSDTSFDSDGRMSVNVSGTDAANELVIDSHGRILVAGSSGSGADMAVIRVKQPDPSPVTLLTLAVRRTQ